MGTYLNNTHIFTNGQSNEQITDVIRTAMNALDFEETSGNDFNLALTIAFTPDSSWSSIFGKRLSDFHALPQKLSETMGYVLNIGVYDSDALRMTLYHDGKQLDEFNDWVNDDVPKTHTGEAALWQPILPAGISYEQLAEIWTPDEEDSPFKSEGVLYRVIELLNLETWRMRGDRDETEFPPDAIIYEMRFRYKHALPYDERLTGEPVFVTTSESMLLTLKLGSTNITTFSFRNQGGETTGIDVLVYGEAIEQGLIEPVGLIKGFARYNYASNPLAISPVKDHDEEGSIIYSFEVPDYTLDAGMNISAIYRLPYYLRDSEREKPFQHGFTLIWRGEKVGTASLDVAICPLANLDGAAIMNMEIMVSELV